MGSQVMGHNTLEFTDADFETDVLGAEGVVMVDFWAEWCPPCRAIAPTVDDIAGEYAGRAKVGKLNVEENKQTTARFGVHGIPALLFFKNGELVEKLTGAHRKSSITQVLDRLID